jgi:hypothetical protein
MAHNGTQQQRLQQFCKQISIGFGGLEVSMLASGTQDGGRKNPQHAFLWKGSKAVCSMSQICGMIKNPAV